MNKEVMSSSKRGDDGMNEELSEEEGIRGLGKGKK